MRNELKLKLINTADNAEMVEVRNISAEVFRQLTFDETVGDEFFIKSSDIVLELAEPLPRHNGITPGHDWIGLYINDLLFNVYQHPGQSNYNELNQKKGFYKYRLYSIQKVFYDHLKSTVLQHSVGSHEWNYNLASSIVTIDEISVQNGSGAPVSSLDRAGFSLGDMLTSLVARDNDYGYQIYSMAVPMPTMNDNDLPIIWRGVSVDIGDTDENIINLNFYENGADIFHTTWFDIFQLAVFGWNAFIAVRPLLVNDKLGIEVSIIPKSHADLGTPLENVKWLERTRITKKYQLNGIRLSGQNFDYEQGDLEGANVLSRSVEISDYDAPMDDHDKQLYWAAGDYNFGTSKYELTAPYFGSGLVQINYSNMISAGHGFEGKLMMIYDDGTEHIIKTLDQIVIGAETIQINTIRGDASGNASIEGIVIG